MNNLLRNLPKIILLYLLISMMLLIMGVVFEFLGFILAINASISLGVSIGWTAYKFANRQFYLEKVMEIEIGNKLHKKIGTALREIYFNFNILNKKKSFLCSFKFKDKTLIQLTHKSHFPQLSNTYDELDFGIAIYINLNFLSKSQVAELDKILKNEMISNSCPIIRPEYFIIDIGENIRLGTKLIDLILTQIFKIQNIEGLLVEIVDEGEIPYS